LIDVNAGRTRRREARLATARGPIVAESRTIGIVVALFSAVSFAVANTLAGVAYAGGSDPLTVSTTRFILPAILIYGMLKLADRPVRLRGPAHRAGIAIGLVTVIYNYALLSAIELLPVSIATLIFFLFPILTAFSLAILGWGRLTAAMIVGAVIAFFGLALALIVRLDDLSRIGMAYAVVAAVGFSVVCVISNRIMRGQDSRQGTLYISVVVTVAMVAVSVAVGEFNLPVTGSGWAGFMASHLLYAAAVIGFFLSISMVGAAATTFFCNLEPLVVIGAGYVLLGQTVSPWQFVGIAIVVGALIHASRSKSDDTITDGTS
jgi:DME family drug/metabolite transporter